MLIIANFGNGEKSDKMLIKKHTHTHNLHSLLLQINGDSNANKDNTDSSHIYITKV